MSLNGTDVNGGARKLNGTTRSTRGAASPSKSALDRGGKKERSTMLPEPHVPEEMDAERAARLEEKQRQLEAVNDRHDNLVWSLGFLHYFQMLSHA